MRPRLLVPLLALAALPASRPAVAPPAAGIAAFNDALDAATRRMDDAATLALWEDDGISLLPGASPIRGRAALGRFLHDATAAHPGARMLSYAQDCHDVEVAGDWGAEWCHEHQVVQFPDGTRFDGAGNLLLVLHRGADGVWRLRREMWNQGAAPGPA